jgi:hypothetical protein
MTHTGKQTKLNNEEFHKFHCSPNINEIDQIKYD